MGVSGTFMVGSGVLCVIPVGMIHEAADVHEMLVNDRTGWS